MISETKNFFSFFAAFLKYSSKFRYFDEKDDPHRFCIFEITDPKNVVI